MKMTQFVLQCCNTVCMNPEANRVFVCMYEYLHHSWVWRTAKGDLFVTFDAQYLSLTRIKWGRILNISLHMYNVSIVSCEDQQTSRQQQIANKAPRTKPYNCTNKARYSKQQRRYTTTYTAHTRAQHTAHGQTSKSIRAGKSRELLWPQENF